MLFMPDINMRKMLGNKKMLPNLLNCYFDDSVHELLGIKDNRFQSLYHFTVGKPLEDKRLETLPAYGHLDHVV